MRASYDIVVAGGGPAAAVAAARLAGGGAHVLVVSDDAVLPHRYQTVTPAAVRLLESLGYDDLATSLAGAAVTSWVRWSDERASAARVDRLVVDRTRLDPALRALALLHGAELVRGSVRRIDPADAAGVRVVVEPDVRSAAASGAPPRAIDVRTGTLVVATGRGRSFLGDRRALTPPTLALVARLGDGDLPADLCVAAVPDGWVWGLGVPGGGHVVVACSDPAPRRAQPELLARMLAHAGWIDELRVDAVTVVGSTSGGAWWTPRSAERVHAIGDAAVALDPLSGQGLSAALRSGVQFADAYLVGPGAGGRIEPVRSNESVAAEHLRTIASAYGGPARRFATPFWSSRADLDPELPVGRHRPPVVLGAPPPRQRALLGRDLDRPS